MMFGVNIFYQVYMFWLLCKGPYSDQSDCSSVRLFVQNLLSMTRLLLPFAQPGSYFTFRAPNGKICNDIDPDLTF